MFDEHDRPAQSRDDPLYAEGMAHFQAGEWEAAIRSFETLESRFPHDAEVSDLLSRARFKARLDAGAKVRPKGVTIRWRPLLVRGALVVLTILAGLLIVKVINEEVRPALARAEEQQEIEHLVSKGQDYLNAGKLADARAAFEDVLARDPGNTEATAGLEKVQRQEQQQALCDEAERLFQAGQLDQALQKFTDLSIQVSGQCNARARITEIKEKLSKDGLFGQAEAAFNAGECAAAVDAYDQIRRQDTTYQAKVISDRLYTCHMQLGNAIVDQKPPALDRLSEALDHFTKALKEQPRDAVAGVEQRLAALVLAGQQANESGRLDDAIVSFAAAVDERPDYLGGLPIQRLYEVYLRRGDQYRDTGDYGLAYDIYRRAMELPGIDTSAARSRRDEVGGRLTPTPTPTSTPTSTPIPTPTAYLPPTPTPTPPPLRSLRGQIIFQADKIGYKGFYVMNPDGSNKRFLGTSPQLEAEYNAIYEREQYSPDGRFRVYSTQDTSRGDQTVNLYIQGKDTDGSVITWRVTNFSKICYDAVWAPDGSRIAFASPERASDDIWVINPDGTNAWNYTPNPWEWEKHPSWSPDSQKIVFWSNREGTKQIYVIDANGQNLKKISGVAPWPEYDPVWIK